MADEPRIEDLRRRVRADPASIAFAQLAEELRRTGQNEEAVTVCRTGLAVYPDYISARVTLGRALIGLNQLDEAERELEQARASAPENPAAARALAELHARGRCGSADIGETSREPSPEAGDIPRRPTVDGAEYLRIIRTLAALESWLAAIHVARADRSA